MSDGQNTCPKCFKKNPTAAAFCGHCGADIRVTKSSDAVPKKTVFGYRAEDIKNESAKVSAPKPEFSEAPTIPLTKKKSNSSADEGKGQSLIGGRFSIVREIKRSGIGVLSFAKDVQENQDVSLLVVDPSVFKSPLDIERARRELRQLQKLDHANIAKIIDHGMDSDKLFITYQSPEGKSLQDIVSAEPLALDKIKHVLSKVGDAIFEAQKVGVIHRDIAPHNIMISADGQIKVLGFAIAPLIKEYIYGTVSFISPEQALGRQVDQRSNIYSLGCLMFYMLTGQPPFSGDVDDVIRKHQNEDPPNPNNKKRGLAINAKAIALMNKALAKSSSRRHLTLRQFLRDVENIHSASADIESDADAKKPTFETPLHGMTSLSGGERPPSSAFTPVKPTASVSALDGGAVSGEMKGGERVSLQQKEEEKRKEESAPKKGAGKDGKFRETMWFFKGELESAMAESGEGKEEEEGHPDDLQDKYLDDGSLVGNKEAQKLSLRTGNTQMMQAVKVPSGVLPGEKMSEKEFISDLNRGKKLGIIFIVGLLIVVGVIVAIIFLK